MINANWESYNYILPMDSALSPHTTDNLSFLIPFLQNPFDGALVELLLKLDIPVDFAVKHKSINEDDKAFLCISTFPDEPEYRKLPPHLAITIYNNEPPAIYSKDDNKDIYVELVLNALGGSFTREDFPKLDFEEYKNRVNLDASFTTILDRVNEIKEDFEAYDFTYQGALTALQEIYDLVLPLLKKEALFTLREAINLLITGSVRVPRPRPDLVRLIDSVYDLPCNKLTYDDDGDAIIDEVILRLKSRPESDTLADLRKNYNDSSDWYESVKNIRENLIVSLKNEIKLAENLYITPDVKVIPALESVIHALSGKTPVPENDVLIKYIENIRPDTMHKYLSPFDGSRPFSHKGTVIIDTTACHDGSVIVESLSNAKRFIIVGNYDRDRFINFIKTFKTADNSLNIVEQTTFDLLKQGFTKKKVSKMLGVPQDMVISELIHKELLNPDASIKHKGGSSWQA